jgi:mRNA-degrading endonuclease toxin of MazEF toxin-antitoxin module
VRIKANTATGLKEPSDVEVDKITTVRVARLTTKIGVLAEKELDKINHAMRVWLDL